MFAGKILYCQPGNAHCKEYIHLDPFDPNHETVAALCIPLEGAFDKLKEEFVDKRQNDLCCLGPEQCSQLKRRACEDPKSMPKSRWVLNIECLSQHLTKAFADGLLSDPPFFTLLEQMINALATYGQKRDMHRALERSSTLLALATNTLKARSAYRALLREISNACDEADVTLHLRDLFPGSNEEANHRNERRCSVCVAGVGKHFRDFLVNQRMGLADGQIGSTLDDEAQTLRRVSNSTLDDLPLLGESRTETVRVQYIVGKEIEDALNGVEGALPFQQLMPNTFLNATVPIYFHNLKIGVINLEWDRKHLEKGFSDLEWPSFPANVPDEGRGAIEQYLRKRLPLVYRMADYLSLVIDYFDDLEYLTPLPTDKQLADLKFVENLSREGALRIIMGYYVGRGMEAAKTLAKKKVEKIDAETLCLQDLVDAVGYFLGSATQLRILVSVRRTLSESLVPVLDHRVSHWLEGPQHQYQANRKKPIPIEDMATVLATSAHRGIPLFGEIKDLGGKKQLVLAKLWSRWFPNETSPTNGKLETVQYSPAGPEPRYEIGVPLVFGRCVLGTFDFEQFALDRTPRAEFQLDEREVCAHLQWGRAITFLIAQLQDARNTLDKRFAPFARFQSLCAQLIADAPVPNSQLMAIATDLFGEIIPVRKVRLERKRATDLFQNTEGRRIAQLRFRGGSDRRISWEWDESSDALLESQSESDPGKTVTTMMTSYSALLLALPRQDLGDDTFLVAIDRILRELSLHEANLSVATNDAGKLGLDVFYRLNELLRLYLPDPSAQAGLTPPTRYAWFLYVRQCASEDGHDAWSCNPDSTRLGETLASCHTREMEDIIDQTRRRTELSSKKRAEQSGTTRRDRIITALIEVLRARSRNAEDEEFKDVIKSITTALADPPSDDALKSAITAHLSRPKSDKDGIVAGKRALGFTRSVARACRPIVVPDINLSPNRSERDHGWFWTYPYTVIGIPFMLEGKCIAVLNVFRERQSSSDMGFFRIEERDKAQQLADKVQELFDKFLATEPLSVPSDEEWRTSLLPLCQALRDRTRAEENKLVVIQSPFARSRESFDELFTHVFSDRAPFSELRDPVRLFDEHRSYLRRNVVIRFDRKHWDTVTKLKELGRDLALIIDHAKRVFLFVSGDEDIGITKSVPFYADHIPFRWLDESLLRRDVTQEKELYGRWLLGSASASISTGNRILARRDGPWSHSAFRAWLFKCGRVAEREDFYAASRHLRRGSSWRPSEQILSLDNWDVQNEKEG